MTGPACIGDPVSWLRLERHRLGELPAAESRAVDAHLAACPACAACDAEIARPLALHPLAPRPDSFWRRARRRLLGAGARGAFARLVPVGAAAAILLLWFTRPGDGPGSRAAPPGGVVQGRDDISGIKGGDVALSLVRERQGIVQHDSTTAAPLTFAPADRWKALVTCSSERVLFWDVAVEEGATTTFPLSPTAPIACGNNVPLPGAFRLSARAPVRICLRLGDDPIERSKRSPREASCVTLRPETGRVHVQ